MLSRLKIEIPGAAHLVLADGVSYINSEESVFHGMLRGWCFQQQSRQLAEDTIEPRLRLVTRLREFTGQYPWEWGPASLEDFTVIEFRSKKRAKSTIRQMQNAIGLFCEYITDARYDWIAVCSESFGKVPVQICTEMNTLSHSDDYEGNPERRAFTANELKAFFDYIDDQYDFLRGRKRKGLLAIVRDSTLFKTIFGWGLRRREAARLAMADRKRNPAIPEYGIYGALHPRYGKAVKGGNPRRRLVHSMPQFDWAIGALQYYCESVRPLFDPGKHPALFITERRSYLNVDWIDQRFVTFRKGAGLPDELDLHCLRHTYASMLAEDNVDGLVIQDQLGHAWLATTGIYTHVSRQFKLKSIREAYDHLYGLSRDEKTNR